MGFSCWLSPVLPSRQIPRFPASSTRKKARGFQHCIPSPWKSSRISWRPGFASRSRDFSPAAPLRFPNPSRFLIRHSQPLPTLPGLSPVPVRGSEHSLDIRIPVIRQRDHPHGSQGNFWIHNIPNSCFPAAGKTSIPADPRDFPTLGSHIPKFPTPPPGSPPEAHPDFPTYPECWEGDPAPIPSALPGFSPGWEAAVGSDPGGCRDHFQKTLPGMEKVGSRKNSGIPSPARGGGGDPTCVPQSFGNQPGIRWRILGNPSPGAGGSRVDPGKSGSGSRSAEGAGAGRGKRGRRSRRAATPPGSGGTFPIPGSPGWILGILPAGRAPIPIPERDCWEFQEEKREVGSSSSQSFGVAAIPGCAGNSRWEWRSKGGERSQNSRWEFPVDLQPLIQPGFCRPGGSFPAWDPPGNGVQVYSHSRSLSFPAAPKFSPLQVGQAGHDP